jgi:hypothetical protein
MINLFEGNTFPALMSICVLAMILGFVTMLLHHKIGVYIICISGVFGIVIAILTLILGYSGP